MRIVPESRTAANCVPDKTMPSSRHVVPHEWFVHVVPSEEVRIVPEDPTAVNFVPDQVMP